LVAQALEAGDPQQQGGLARQALERWPDCADAYVLLAEHAGSRPQAPDLYPKRGEARARALGPAAFERAGGPPAGALETRPHRRARLGLAHALWTAGRRTEAVEHLQDMLRLNPNDNQGARYPLAGFLLFLDRDDELARLLQHYPEEGTAAWAYTQALLAFPHGGHSPPAPPPLPHAL